MAITQQIKAYRSVKIHQLNVHSTADFDKAGRIVKITTNMEGDTPPPNLQLHL